MPAAKTTATTNISPYCVMDEFWMRSRRGIKCGPSVTGRIGWHSLPGGGGGGERGEGVRVRANPSTPKSDQFKISPAASQEIIKTSHSMKNLAFHSLLR